MAHSIASAPELPKKTLSANVVAAKLLGERLLLRDPEEIGDVPELAGLLGQRLDQRRVGVAERIDGDAAGEIEHAAAVGGLEPHALAAREGDRRARERVVERRLSRALGP